MPKRLDSISRQPKTDPEIKAPASETTPAATPPVTPPAESSVPMEKAAEKPVEVTPKTEEKVPEKVPAKTEDTPVKEDVKEGDTAEPAKADSFDSLFPEPSVIMSGPPGWVWWILLIIGAAGLGFLAFSLTRSQIDNWLSINPSPSATVVASTSPSATASTSPSSTPATSPTPTATPTATPTSTGVVKSSITMRILNGTTTGGAAGSMKTQLEKDGFTIRTIGNANNQNYTTTTIYYQSGKQADAQLVADALAPLPTTLEESSLANPDMVLIVVGSKK